MEATIKRSCVTVFTAVYFALALGARAADLDEDGFDDAIEDMLIDRHRPILVYEDDERHWPISAEAFVRASRLRWNTHPELNTENGCTNRKYEYPWLQDIYSQEELISDPLLILRGGERRPGQPSNTQEQPCRGDWYLDIDDGVQGGHYPGADGSSHEGMYAHVVPLEDGRILLQYWQLFPMNEAECVSDCGDHEGDWTYLELFLEGAPPHKLINILYHHHGDGNCPPTSLPFPGGQVGLIQIEAIPLPADGIPVCFVEEQAHEWWPWPSGGEECDFDPTGFGFCFNASHHGNGIRYRVPRVENIGERYAPMPGSLSAQLILFYNSRWGGWGSECFDHWFEPPDSPVHQNWPNPSKLSRVYVDRSANYSEPGLGSRYRPFSSLYDASQKLLPSGVMLLKPDSYAESVTLSTAMTIEAWP